jgi:uncharacterized protein
MKKHQRPHTHPPSSSWRLSFPFDEARLIWLPMLLDAYATADQGIDEAVHRQEKPDRRLACSRGCSACCRSHTTIPVFPLELVGVYWYATEKLTGDIRPRLIEKLQRYQPGTPCPFLVDGICAIHPMRFLACRHFNVFGTPCAEGEDAYYTRRHDVLTPIRSYQDRALAKMLPFHGIRQKTERRQALKNGFLNSQVKVMQELDWRKLADRMTCHPVST